MYKFCLFELVVEFGNRQTEAATLGAGRAFSTCMNTGVRCECWTEAAMHVGKAPSLWRSLGQVLNRSNSSFSTIHWFLVKELGTSVERKKQSLIDKLLVELPLEESCHSWAIVICFNAWKLEDQGFGVKIQWNVTQDHCTFTTGTIDPVLNLGIWGVRFCKCDPVIKEIHRLTPLIPMYPPS